MTESLTELSKKATPSDVVNVVAIRKAMGISVESPIEKECGNSVIDVDEIRSTEVPSAKGISSLNENIVNEPVPLADALTRAVEEATSVVRTSSLVLERAAAEAGIIPEELTDGTAPQLAADDQVGDLEDELREFLETGPALRGSDSPSQVDVSLDDVIP